MKAAGIVHEASEGRYWLDLVAYDADQVRHHRIFKGVLAVALLVLAIAIAFPLFRL